MDVENEKYQQAMFALFRSKGWKFLVEELENLREVVDRLEAVRDNDDLKFRQGQLNVIALVLNLPTEVERMDSDAENL